MRRRHRCSRCVHDDSGQGDLIPVVSDVSGPADFAGRDFDFDSNANE
jgi:hypothetical protein